MSTTHYCQQAVLLLLRKIYQEWMSWRSPQLEWISCLYLRNQSHCLVVKWKLSINWACMNAYKAVFHQSLDFSVRLSPISNSVLGTVSPRHFPTFFLFWKCVKMSKSDVFTRRIRHFHTFSKQKKSGKMARWNDPLQFWVERTPLFVYYFLFGKPLRPLLPALVYLNCTRASKGILVPWTMDLDPWMASEAGRAEGQKDLPISKQSAKTF